MTFQIPSCFRQSVILLALLLLALSGSLILVLVFWIMLEGLGMLVSERGQVPAAAEDAPF